MYYAVNVADLTKFAVGPLGSPALIMLRPVLAEQIVQCEPGLDGAGVLVKEDTPQERWDAIYEIIRNGLGRQQPIPKHELRIYESKTGRGGWKRI